MRPAEIKPATFEQFEIQYAVLPMPPTFAGCLFTYAEFVLPVCLVLGFATRLSVLMQVHVTADALWTTHIYIVATMMVLMSAGPGAIALDALIRTVHRKQAEPCENRAFVASLWPPCLNFGICPA